MLSSELSLYAHVGLKAVQLDSTALPDRYVCDHPEYSMQTVCGKLLILWPVQIMMQVRVQSVLKREGGISAYFGVETPTQGK